MAILRSEFSAGFGKGWREAAAIVGQHVGEPERERRGGFAQESNGALLGFVVLDRAVDEARTTVDGDEQVALAPFAIRGLQLGQMLDVDM